MAPAVVAALAGGGMGMINDFLSSGRNRTDAATQFKRQKELMDKSYQLQYDMWKKTNYRPQVEELKAAGLNPGLIYGMSGGGATTTGGGGGSAAMAAPVNSQAMAGVGMGIQLELMKAQKENIEADTKGKLAEVPKTEAETSNLLQGLDNLREDYQIKRLQQTMMNIENYEKQASQEDRLDYIEYQTGTALRSLQTLKNEGKISDETVRSKIDIIKAEAIGAILKNRLTTEQITQVKESIKQGWEGLTQGEQKIKLDGVIKQVEQMNTTDKTTIPMYYHDKGEISNIIERILNRR